MLDLSQTRNQACLFIAGIGLFFVLMTYGAYIASKRSGHFVSGVPLFGGLLILIGFLISTNRWFCLLALTDPACLMLPYTHMLLRKDRKRYDPVFGTVLRERGFVVPPHRKDMNIRVTSPADSLLHWLQYLHPYYLRVPRIAFMLCADAGGNQYFLLDRYTGEGAAEVLPFDGQRITVNDIAYRGQTVSVTVEIVPEENR